MKRPTIAYYAAEYAIDDELPIYAGGLGVLAADYLLEAGEQGWPVVAFGAAYQHVGAAKNWRDGKSTRLLKNAGFERLGGRGGKPFETVVDFGDWQVRVGAWQKHFGKARLILIDANLPGNSDLNRHLTANLYDPDTVTRLLQQFVMARASVAILDHLRIVPDRYHLNEGHMAFVPLVLAARYSEAYGLMPLIRALATVRRRVVSTKHTILSGAGDFADETTLDRLFGKYLAKSGWTAHDLVEVGASDKDQHIFSTTAFMIRTSNLTSAVSRLHAEVEHKRHPNSMLVPVTNGVFRPRWQSEAMSAAEEMSDEKLWEAHGENRRALVEHVNRRLGTALDPERLTVVWARRFAPYKRPTLAFTNVRRLQQLMAGEDGFQLVVSGNANEIDEQGIQFLEQIMAHAQDPGFGGRLVYLPHYATDVSQRLVAGADVWLNTPIRGLEACGTSGMKAGLNGALQLSTKDGWVDEVDLGEIGWELPNGETAAALYHALERKVLPEFYARDSEGLPHAWLAKMRAVMDLTERQFTAERMLEDYRKRLYRV